MTISTAFTPSFEPQTPEESKFGITRFTFNPSITGDASGGYIRFDCNLNPAARDLLRYVRIDRWWVSNDGASMAVSARIKAGDYEVFGGNTYDRNVASLVAANSRYSADLVSPDVPIYCGRIMDNELGELETTFTTNTDTKVYIVHIEGVMSPEPLVGTPGVRE